MIKFNLKLYFRSLEERMLVDFPLIWERNYLEKVVILLYFTALYLVFYLLFSIHGEGLDYLSTIIYNYWYLFIFGLIMTLFTYSGIIEGLDDSRGNFNELLEKLEDVPSKFALLQERIILFLNFIYYSIIYVLIISAINDGVQSQKNITENRLQAFLIKDYNMSKEQDSTLTIKPYIRGLEEEVIHKMSESIVSIYDTSFLLNIYNDTLITSKYEEIVSLSGGFSSPITFDITSTRSLDTIRNEVIHHLKNSQINNQWTAGYHIHLFVLFVIFFLATSDYFRTNTKSGANTLPNIFIGYQKYLHQKINSEVGGNIVLFFTFICILLFFLILLPILTAELLKIKNGILIAVLIIIYVYWYWFPKIKEKSLTIEGSF